MCRHQIFTRQLTFFCRTYTQVCKASNQFGEQRVEVRLHVNAYLSVHIHPQVQIVNSGGTAVFNCSVAGVERLDAGHVEWLHNGVPLVLQDGAGVDAAAARK